MPTAPACMASPSSRRITPISAAVAGRRSWPIDLRAQAAEAHQRRHVARRPRPVDGVEVLLELPPHGQHLGIDAEERRELGQTPARPRRHAAVADHDRGHPLTKGAVHPGVGERRQVRVRVDVDEAGGDDEAVGVHDPGATTGASGFAAVDAHDATIGHGDGRRERRTTPAVDHEGIPHQQIEHAPTLPRGEESGDRPFEAAAAGRRRRSPPGPRPARGRRRKPARPSRGRRRPRRWTATRTGRYGRLKWPMQSDPWVRSRRPNGKPAPARRPATRAGRRRPRRSRWRT